jgi:hypothetical protein
MTLAWKDGAGNLPRAPYTYFIPWGAEAQNLRSRSGTASLWGLAYSTGGLETDAGDHLHRGTMAAVVSLSGAPSSWTATLNATGNLVIFDGGTELAGGTNLIGTASFTGSCGHAPYYAG